MTELVNILSEVLAERDEARIARTVAELRSSPLAAKLSDQQLLERAAVVAAFRRHEKVFWRRKGRRTEGWRWGYFVDLADGLSVRVITFERSQKILKVLDPDVLEIRNAIQRNQIVLLEQLMSLQRTLTTLFARSKKEKP